MSHAVMLLSVFRCRLFLGCFFASEKQPLGLAVLAVGLAVGSEVVGFAVGLAVGLAVGFAVGFAVGLNVVGVVVIEVVCEVVMVDLCGCHS